MTTEPPFDCIKDDRREHTGGSVSYYSVRIGSPLSGNDAYTAECNDLIEALGMNYAEGNAFKAIWRSCAARYLGVSKRGYNDAVYDAEKVVFFGGRMIEQADIATLEQEIKQVRARLARVEGERDELLAAMRRAVVAGAHHSIEAKNDCYDIIDAAIRECVKSVEEA